MRTAPRCRCSRIPNSPQPLLIGVARKRARTALPKLWARAPRLRSNRHWIMPTSAARSRAFWQRRGRRDAPHLKLRFDGRLIDDRPNLHDLPAAKFVDHILAKANPLPVDVEAKERSLRRAVEVEPARDVRWIGNQH